MVSPDFFIELPIIAPSLVGLGMAAFGIIVHCVTCGQPREDSIKKCPEDGNEETVEALKIKMRKVHEKVEEIWGDDGLPTCGSSDNDGGGGASSGLILFRGLKKKVFSKSERNKKNK